MSVPTSSAVFPYHPQIANLIDHDLMAKCESKYGSAPNGIYRTLCDKSAKFDRLRDDLESLLAFAEREGLLDGKLRGELRSLSETAWYSAIAELETALIFHKAGLSIRRMPSGKGQKFGDFEIVGETPIFVEVKTLFDDDERTLHRLVRRKLWQSTRMAGKGLQISCIVALGRIRNLADFNAGAFEKSLRANLQSPSMTPSGISFVYVDKSGFEIEVDIKLGRSSLPGAHPIGPWQHLWGNFNQAYKRAIKKKLKQIPKDRPSLLVIRSYLSFPLEADDIRELTDWCFQPDTRTRLSALALLTDGSDGHRLSIYKNTHAAFELPHTLAGRKGIWIADLTDDH